MAKPDCDDGWYKKSIELEAALDFADFTKIARTILRYGFCQIFGQGRRPKFIRLGCSEVAQRIGKDRQQVFRAFDELVKSGAIAPVGNKPDTYRFVKNYEKWMKVRRSSGLYEATAEPRLDRIEVAESMAAPAYSAGFVAKTHADECVSHLDDTSKVSVSHLDDTSEVVCQPSGLQNVIQTDYTEVFDASKSPRRPRIANIVSDDTYESAPRLRRTRPELIEMDVIKNKSSEIPPRRGIGITPDHGDIPDNGSLAPGLVAEFDRLSLWVRGKLGDEGYEAEAFEESDRLCLRWLSSGGDPEWCAQAFQASIDNINILEKTTYARGILRRMYLEQKAGEPVLAPSFCDYRPSQPEKPGVPEQHRLEATGTAPAQYIPRPSKAQRDSDRYQLQKAGIMQMFPVPPKEDHLEES